MKTRLITLLSMGHTLDPVKDRTGAYTLRHVNKFPKFRPVARAAAVTPPPARQAAPSAQPMLFEGAKAPAAVAPPQNSPDRADQAHQPPAPGAAMCQSSVAGRAVLPVGRSLGEGACPPQNGSATLIPLPMPDGGQGTARPTSQDEGITRWRRVGGGCGWREEGQEAEKAGDQPPGRTGRRGSIGADRRCSRLPKC